MLDAMNVLGNPSSVHFEGRMAKSLLENARESLAGSLAVSPIYCLYIWVNRGCFVGPKRFKIKCSEVEHDAVKSLWKQL